MRSDFGSEQDKKRRRCGASARLFNRLTASRRQAQLWSKRTSRSVPFIIISFLIHYLGLFYC